jgi:perilipin-2
MFNWAFRTTENVVRGAVIMSTPLVNKFDTPINFVDQTLVKGLDKLELRAPIIKEQPAEILIQAKAKVMDVVQPQINKVCQLRRSGEKKAASLKELSYNKAKEVLATSYGSMCVNGIDSTAVLAERLLDSFFPKTAEDDAEDSNSTLTLTFVTFRSLAHRFHSTFRTHLGPRRSGSSYRANNWSSKQQGRPSCLSYRLAPNYST